MYYEIPAALKAGAFDSSVVVTVLTGAGSYYCSGNDLSTYPLSYLTWEGVDMNRVTQEFASTIQWVSYFIFQFSCVNTEKRNLAEPTKK